MIKIERGHTNHDVAEVNGVDPQCFQAFSSTRKSLGTNTNLPRMFIETIAFALSLALLRLVQAYPSEFHYQNTY